MSSDLPTAEAAAWSPADEVAFLEGMLAHYTPSGDERALSQWLVDRLGAIGVSAEVDEVGNLIATLPPTDTANAGDATGTFAPVVLLGHVDTAPGFIPPRREGERLYGRGAVDAKGPMAAFLAALVRQAASARPRLRPVIVVGAVEEEAATSRGARAVVDRWQPAFAIIGEPSGVDAVTLGYKGRLLVDFRVEAPVAHTARPEEGVCARGVAFWSALATDAAAWNAELEISRAFDTIAPSLRTITSGSDGFTDWCALTIGYRLPIGYDVTSLTGAIEAQARAAGGTVKFRGHEPAYRAERRGQLVAAFLRALRAEGMEPTFKVKTGTSDMNVVGPVWQCPILAYGPGDAALDHTPDEHIAIPEYLMSIAVLERTLSDLVTAPSPSRLPDDRH